MKVSNNFYLQEFIDPLTWQNRGEKSIELIDFSLISIAQALRDHFNASVTVNNWHAGGQYKESGLRNFFTKTGALYSQHKFGRAIDCKVAGYDPEEIRQHILANQDTWMALGLTTIEKGTPSWVHIDTRYTGHLNILQVPFK